MGYFIISKNSLLDHLKIMQGISYGFPPFGTYTNHNKLRNFPNVIIEKMCTGDLCGITYHFSPSVLSCGKMV